ncbi:MAG: pyridoxal phosphate-dependent aminotransferase [Candidatus Micrarchaeota archaeon]
MAYYAQNQLLKVKNGSGSGYSSPPIPIVNAASERLNALAAKNRENHKRGGKAPVNFGLGDAGYSLSPETRRRGVEKFLETGSAHYTPVGGDPAYIKKLRPLVEQVTGLDVPEENIVVGGGARNMNFVAFSTFSVVDRSGRHKYLAATPTWATFEDQIKLVSVLSGKNGAFVKIETRDGKIPVESLERALAGDKTIGRIIYQNFVNPSGAAYSEKEAEAIATLAAKHECLVLDDGTYSVLSRADGARYNGIIRASLTSGDEKASQWVPTHTIFTFSVHKVFGSGIRNTSAVIFCEGLRKNFKSALGTITGPAGTVDQSIMGAFVESGELRNAIAHYDEKAAAVSLALDWLKKTFEENFSGAVSMRHTEPEGAYYVQMKFKGLKGMSYKHADDGDEAESKHSIQTHSDFCDYLLRKVNVKLQPGEASLVPSNPNSLSVRLCFGPPKKEDIFRGIIETAFAVHDLLLANGVKGIKPPDASALESTGN